MSVVRDRAWIDREFNQEKWPVQLKLAEELLQSGERDLSRIISLVQKRHREGRNSGATDLAPFEVLADGQRAKVPKIMALEGYRAWITQNILSACQANTDLVVELGSGVGHGLFRLWLAGGPWRAKYVACELTQSGRECAERIASVEPEIDFSALPFDLLDPDYGAIPGEARHAVVFTVQAIEQVPEIPEEAFTRLLDKLNNITCLHIEPVGWQITSNDISEAAHAYGAENDYNRNLWSVLTALEQRGVLNIEEALPNIYGVRPLNPQTLIRWRAA